MGIWCKVVTKWKDIGLYRFLLLCYFLVLVNSSDLHYVLEEYIYYFSPPHLACITPFDALFPGHNSMIYFIDDIGTSPAAQNLALHDLPLRDVGQHFLFY
jgi:hypothetical protein